MDKSLIINKIKLHLGIKTDTELAIFLGVKQPTISAWRSRNTLDYDLIITKCKEIDANWLITGEGNMLKEEQQEVSVQNTISTNDNEIISLLKAQLKDKEDKEALYKEKIADLEEKLKFAEFRDKKDMDFKIKAQRKEIKDIISEKDEIIFAQNEEINALKSRHLPPDEPLQPSKGL